MYTLVLLLLLHCFIGPGGTQEGECDFGNGHQPLTDDHQCLGPGLDAAACGGGFTCFNGLCCPVNDWEPQEEEFPLSTELILDCEFGNGHQPFTDDLQCLEPELDEVACGEGFMCVTGFCCPREPPDIFKCNIGEGHRPFTDNGRCPGLDADEEVCGEGFTCVAPNIDFGFCCPVGEGPCHQSLQHANLFDGTFVPKCNSDGTFEVWQCFNEWTCFCVTLDGIVLGPNARDWYFPNLHNQAMCEDLVGIYKHLCEDESKLDKLVKRLVQLHTTARHQWQKKHPAPDSAGREELNELWDLMMCVRKLLLRVEELKKKIDLGEPFQFRSIEKELSSILEKMAQKVDAMFDLINTMNELGFRKRDRRSLADAGESFDNVQDELILALLKVAERALEEIRQAKAPVPNLPEKVTDICKGTDGLLDNCLDLLINYQAIRRKLKKLTDKNTYPYGEMSDLFTCISNFCNWVKELHEYLRRIKRGELNPKKDDVLTELGEVISNIQKASAKLLDYRQKLLHEISELGLGNKFEKLFATDEDGLNAHLEEMEQLVDAITEAFNNLFLDSLDN